MWFSGFTTMPPPRFITVETSDVPWQFLEELVVNHVEVWVQSLGGCARCWVQSLGEGKRRWRSACKLPVDGHHWAATRFGQTIPYQGHCAKSTPRGVVGHKVGRGGAGQFRRLKEAWCSCCFLCRDCHKEVHPNKVAFALAIDFCTVAKTFEVVVGPRRWVARVPVTVPEAFPHGCELWEEEGG